MTDDPKRKSGGSKRFAEESRRLQLYMSLREVVNRLNELIDRLGQLFMIDVEPPPSTPLPPPPDPPESLPGPRPSMNPTISQQAMNARTFERVVRTRFDEADSESKRQIVREMLRNGLENSPEFANDERLRQLESELRNR